MRKWLPPFTRPLVSHRWKWDGRFPLLQRGKNEFARVGQVDFCFLRPRDSILFLFTRLRAKFNSDSSSLIRAILAERLILVRCTIYRDDLIETRYYSLEKRRKEKEIGRYRVVYLGKEERRQDVRAVNIAFERGISQRDAIIVTLRTRREVLSLKIIPRKVGKRLDMVKKGRK